MGAMSQAKKQRTEDWESKIGGVYCSDWARAGCAADAVVGRAMEYLKAQHKQDFVHADALLAQHVKAQLSYISALRTVNLSGNVDGDIGCYLNNTLDVNLANKDDTYLSVQSGVELSGRLDVDVDTQDGGCVRVQKP
jgi:hypothetical protein